MELIWWHWVAMGLGLIALEMFVSTFFLLWFGLGALITGLVVVMLPLGFTAQILLWTLASAAMVAVWLKYFKSPDRTHAGQAKEGVVGLTGLGGSGSRGYGKVKFATLLLDGEDVLSMLGEVNLATAI